MVELHGWPVWLDTVKMALGQGYSFAELRETVARDGTLQNLPACQSGDMPQTARNRASIPTFSLEELQNHLVAFIVADDQACILLTFLRSSSNFMSLYSPSMLWNVRSSGSCFCSFAKTFLMKPRWKIISQDNHVYLGPCRDHH